jgi:hypothetical protein
MMEGYVWTYPVKRAPISENEVYWTHNQTALKVVPPIVVIECVLIYIYSSATVSKQMLHEVHRKMNLNIDTVEFHVGFEAKHKLI